jgi:hypothetical protein
MIFKTHLLMALAEKLIGFASVVCRTKVSIPWA